MFFHFFVREKDPSGRGKKEGEREKRNGKGRRKRGGEEV